ncbi:MAG TPA: hypothetical protein DF699_08265, partial [Phycisphaerales bacterium]|nr:hypothetical protein [Phycisphaerales bacterium]
MVLCKHFVVKKVRFSRASIRGVGGQARRWFRLDLRTGAIGIGDENPRGALWVCNADLALKFSCLCTTHSDAGEIMLAVWRADHEHDMVVRGRFDTDHRA